MWAAWHLKQLEPEARVVLLEADRCGYGPSGRNGGFCNVMWFSLPNMRGRWGDAGALAVARAAEAAARGIGDFCASEGVDAWYMRGGYLQVSTAKAHDGKWAEALAACQELGVGDAIQPLSPEQIGERCASPAFRGGAFYPDAATVQPARLALGLRERLRARGVEVCEGTPVTRLAGSPHGVEAHTAGGVVRARSAVLAVGAAAKAPRGPLRNGLTVASSHIVMTEPVPDLLEEVGWTGGECITDSRALIDYFRTTPDGRIALRLGRRPDRDGRPTPRALRDGRGRDLADSRAPMGLLPRSRGAAPSPTPGAVRSTPRQPTCPSSSPCAAAAPSPPPATPATASAPPTWSAAPSLLWPWTAATAPPALPSSTRRHLVSHPSPSAGSVEKRSAPRSCARRTLSSRAALRA